jgi:hypothetical protein
LVSRRDRLASLTVLLALGVLYAGYVIVGWRQDRDRYQYETKVLLEARQRLKGRVQAAEERAASATRQVKVATEEAESSRAMIGRYMMNQQGDELSQFMIKYDAAVGQFQGQKQATARVSEWILAGQSNAAGRAQGIGFDPVPRVLMFDPASASWHVAKEPLANMNGVFGAFHVAAVEYSRSRPDTLVKLAGFATGGQSIAYWDVGAEGWEELNKILKACGKDASLFVWYQGETDAKLEGGMAAAVYHAKLRDLALRVRAQSGNPTLLVVVVQLGNSTNGNEFFARIREAQRSFVANDPNALLVPAVGLPLQDHSHLAREGYIALGRHIAAAVVRHESGAGAWPGPVLDAAVLDKDPRTVHLHFAEVTQLHGVLAQDFGIASEKRFLPCGRLSFGKRTVTLHFDEPVPFPAKVLYGYGNNPVAALRDEAGLPAPAMQIDLTTAEPLADGTGTRSSRGAGMP